MNVSIIKVPIGRWINKPPMNFDFKSYNFFNEQNFNHAHAIEPLSFPVFDEKNFCILPTQTDAQSAVTTSVSMSKQSDTYSEDDTSKTLIRKAQDYTPAVDKTLVGLINTIHGDHTCLNDWVHDLIATVDLEEGHKRKRIISKKVLRRKKKTPEQIMELTKFLNRNPVWDKSMCAEICDKTGLRRNQVYKWYWENKPRD